MIFENNLSTLQMPNGGVKSKIYYMDDNEDLVDKYEATILALCELDENGNQMNETNILLVGKENKRVTKRIILPFNVTFKRVRSAK